MAGGIKAGQVHDFAAWHMIRHEHYLWACYTNQWYFASSHPAFLQIFGPSFSNRRVAVVHCHAGPTASFGSLPKKPCAEEECQIQQILIDSFYNVVPADRQSLLTMSLNHQEQVAWKILCWYQTRCWALPSRLWSMVGSLRFVHC